mmetsp:Transcript_44230/g.42931  ORF Transcript_44230/g.42931 Transcript_44230/m.42931 type:complete len:157 (-) Transcript_44230:51-521(-)
MSALRSSRQAPSHQSLFQSTCSSIGGLNLKEIAKARKSRQEEENLKLMRSSVEALLSYPPQQRTCESTKNINSYSSQNNILSVSKQENNCFVESDPLILQMKVKNLEEKLEEAYRQQHQLENMLEEYEVTIKRQDDSLKLANKKCNDLQKKYWACS